MRVGFVAVVATVTLLAVNDPVMATVDANQPTLVTSNNDRSSTINSKRILRTYKKTDEDNADDEERNLFGDFAKSDLKEMLKSESFKLKMFKKWDQHTGGHIREKSDVSPLNTRWESLLFDYLNVYKKAGDEVVRHANNLNKMEFSNKVRARLYRTNS